MTDTLINTYHGFVNEKDSLHNALNEYEIQGTSLSSRIHDLEEVLRNVKNENNALNAKLTSHSKNYLKGKVKSSNI